MLNDIVGKLFLLSLGLIVFGICQYFTSERWEDWSPGLGTPWGKRLSDSLSLKVAFLGVILFVVVIIIEGILIR